MLPGRKYTAQEIIRILKLRWWMILLPLIVGASVGILAYKRLPVKYRSETLIMVVPQRVPDSYVKATVTNTVEERLQAINEQIQSRSRLERIIQDFDLYPVQRGNGIMQDVVEAMRSDITVKLEGSRGKESSFRVGFTYEDPKITQKVTERLATLYIDENLRDRENLADSTNTFLESQLQDAKQRLLEQEKKLEAYRQRYSGQLPSQLTGNLQAIQTAQMQLQSLGEAMNRARERRLLVERQIADSQTFPAEVVAPGVANASPETAAVLPTAQQLDVARARLEVYQKRYTSDHPDVVALTQRVHELEAKLKDEATRDPASSEGPVSRAEAARQKRLRDLQAELEVIDRQLATGQSEEENLKRTLAEYRGKIEAVPARESELVELTRDYTTLQETYASLLQRREDARIAADMERRQIGEQFRILDPASLPERPANQKQRLALLAGSPAAGLALGLLVVAFLERRDSSFRSEDDVVRVLSLPVLALIPVMGDGSESPGKSRRQRRVAGATAAAIVLAFLSAGL